MKGKYIQINHPVLQHKLSFLREKKTDSSHFRNLVHEIGGLLAYEVTKELELETIEIQTPLVESAPSKRIKNKPIVVSILRAGNAMMEGIIQMLPFTAIGHIGIYRDKFINNTVEYYFKLPQNHKNKMVLLTDPMLATGDTMVASIDRLKQYGVGDIKVISILVSKEGVEKVHHFHPDVDIYALDMETELSPEGYLLPGMGDVGDRLFRTKDFE